MGLFVDRYKIERDDYVKFEKKGKMEKSFKLNGIYYI